MFEVLKDELALVMGGYVRTGCDDKLNKIAIADVLQT